MGDGSERRNELCNGFEHRNEDVALNVKWKMNNDSKRQMKKVMTLDVDMKLQL